MDYGWEYLKAHEIKQMKCDDKHNFAFISYAHSDCDTGIVDSVFRTLTLSGYNLWIDTANMPYNSNHWKNSANSALENDNCKMLLYFRSEDSITRRTIADELQKFADIHGKDNIIVIEIYRDKTLHTRHYRALLKEKAEASSDTCDSEKAKCCDDICGIVSESCKAFQLKSYDSIEKMCYDIQDELTDRNIMQRFSLQDKILYILDGTYSIKPQGKQLDAFRVFEQMVKDSIGPDGDGKKRTLIIKGGPGTGKSVLLMYMLSWLRSKEIYRNKRLKWVSKNNSPRMAYEAKLKSDIRNSSNADKLKAKQLKEDFKNIFCGPKSIELLQEKSACDEVCDVLFLDEAHRLTVSDRYNPTINLAYQMFTAGIVTVVVADDNQIVTTSDSGNENNIFNWTKDSGAKIQMMKMESQLRCSGSDTYLDWVDGVLEINSENKYLAKTSDYDLRVYDDPQKMYEDIIEKNQTDSPSRILAGYCWDWKQDGRDSAEVYDIVIDRFRISWNLMSGTTFAADDNSINQAGCIHTVQGLEFRYVGVIFGDDIRYENGRIVTDVTKRASTDASVRGLKTKIKKSGKSDTDSEMTPYEKTADSIIKNTYRVLMTRGVKGCYIYCVDKALNDYMRETVNEYNERNTEY